jgi:hypothetical protein
MRIFNLLLLCTKYTCLKNVKCPSFTCSVLYGFIIVFLFRLFLFCFRLLFLSAIILFYSFLHIFFLFLFQFFRYHVCFFFYVSICPLMFQKQNMFKAHSHCSTLCSQSGNFEFKQFPLPFFYFCYRQTHKQQTNSIHMIKTDFCFQAVRSSNVRSFVLLDIRYLPSN